MADVEGQSECQRNDTTRSPGPDATRANDDVSSAMKLLPCVGYVPSEETHAATHDPLLRLLGPGS
jgi:hypothetical protein